MIIATDRCLIVEDSYIIFMDLEDIVMSMGFNFVDQASNLEQAREHLERRRYRLALLDLRLGNDSSTAVIRRLKTLKIPFAVTSGFNHDDDLAAGLGNIPVIQKPYVIDRVKETIIKLLKNSS